MSKGHKKTDLQNLPACAAEFIRQVLRKMRYRRKVTQDVQAELAAHFEDELKDYATDEEKEQKAQQLITNFGDVKLLAVLLRRAKKRCRPLWRTVVARSFQAVGILILCFIVYVVWFLTGKPVITTDYVAELNRIVRPTADESLNAAPLYHKAVDLHKELSDDFLLFFTKNHQAVVDERFPRKVELLAIEINKVLSNKKLWNYQEKRQDVQAEVRSIFYKFLEKKYNELTVEQRNIAQRWVQERNDALELIIEGSQKPYYWRTYISDAENPGEMIAVRLPHLPEFRKLVYALRWRAWLRAEQGRFEDSFADIKSCYRFGKHIKNVNASLIEQLVGMATERLAAQALLNVLSEHKIDSATLFELQQDFERMIADENFAVSFKFEKLGMYDVIQRCFTEDRFGGGHLSLDGIRGSMTDSDLFEFILEGKHWTAPLHILFTHPNKRESREMADRYCAFWEKMVCKNPAQTRAEGIDIEKEAMEIIKGNMLLEFLTPALGKINEISHRNKAGVEVTLAIIAILRYRQDTGDYPQNLQELVAAGYLKKIPLDPFSDKPLIYKKTDDNFILYSFGPDFKDDNGVSGKDKKGRAKQWMDNGDTVFWPLPESDIKQ
jgi:hypothetical protein